MKASGWPIALSTCFPVNECLQLADLGGFAKLKERRDCIASKAKASTPMLELRRRSFQEILEEHGIAEASAANTAMRLFEEVRFGKVYLYKNTVLALILQAQHA